MDYLNKLNPAQKAAVIDTEGPVLVLAGAGSGKTRVLTSRIAYLIDEKGVDPNSILAITFTNKAANEMLARLVDLVGDGAYDMWISTIHSMCVRILRASIGKLDGYDKNFTIYSEVDKERVLKRIMTDLKMEDLSVKDAKYHISNAKNNDISPNRYLIECQSSVKSLDRYVKIYEVYEQTLKKSNAMDFDDLLVKTLHLLEDNEDVLDYYAHKFRYIHIDEFQDTNAIQYSIAKMLSSAHGNIFVVGDDDQSVYGWRGAEIKNILGFDKDFKNTKVYKLEQNYRSTKKILDLANTIIKNNSFRSSKVLWTDNPDGERVEFYIGEEESGEAEYVSAKIKNLVARGYDYKDFAVLMRINALSRSFEQEFTKYAIPFKVFGGFKFFDRKEIKDITAYLRLLVNPLDDEAALRIINTPKRGIGDKTIETLINYAKQLDFSIFDALCEVEKIPDISQAARSRLKEFRTCISSLTLLSATTTDLPELINEVLLKTSFMSQFEIDTEENLSKRMNIDEFRNSVEEFCRLNKNATLEDYLASVTLSSDIDEADSSDYVAVATIHAVKGLEFKCVFIVGLDETIFPISRAAGSPAELEEERRLMYVAITRAKERLHLTRARSRYLYGSREYTSQSRFVDELADKLGVAPKKRQNVYENTTYRRSYNSDEPDTTPESRVNFGGVSSFAKSYSSGMAPKTGGVKNYAEFKPGKRVKHAKFGVGTIIQIKGSGQSTVADVAFKGIGVKSFSLAIAPMEVID